jgi:acylphosphatase
VQGVAFRWSTAEEARRLGLAGWVRNCRDGTVELEAEGPIRDLKSLLDWLQHGPPLARVLRVVARWEEPVGERRDGFDVVG